MTKDKTILAKFGAFEVTQDGATRKYIRIRSIDGTWSMSFREDNPMYPLWLMMCNDPGHRKGMEVLGVMAFSLTNQPLDEEFIRQYYASLAQMAERRSKNTPEPSEEEERLALDEIRLADEAKNAL